jgi:hypothetical protein
VSQPDGWLARRNRFTAGSFLSLTFASCAQMVCRQFNPAIAIDHGKMRCSWD